MKNKLLSLLLIVFGALSPLFAQQTSDSLALADSLRREALQLKITNLSVRITAVERVFALARQDAQTQLDSANSALKAAHKDSTRTKEEHKTLKVAQGDAQKVQKKAAANHKEAAGVLRRVQKLESMPLANAEKEAGKLDAQILALEQRAGLVPIPEETPIAAIIGAPAVSAPDTLPLVVADSTLTAAPPADSASTAPTGNKQRTKAQPVGPQYKAYDPKADVMLNPPSAPCVLIRDVRDEFSGETYRELQRGELFRFNNEYEKKIMPPGQSHIVCEAALAEKGNAASLWLTFSVRDPNARKTFGGFTKNSQAVLKFMDGTTVNIFNLRADEGVADASGNVIQFKAQYNIDKETLKKLERTELDKIRIAWATGYEDYDVQNVNLLRRQASCL